MTNSSTEKNGLKKGPWTPEEDQKLIDYIHKHGHGKWRTIPKNAGLKRCGKSCRLRWANYLRPDIKRGRFSFEEEEAIIQLHSVLGNKWSTIAANLPGRTDNEIKNYWNTHIKKKLFKMGIDPVTHTPRLDVLQLASILNTSLFNSSPQFNHPFLSGIGRSVINPTHLLSLLSTLLSCQSRNNPDNVLNHNNYQQTISQLSGNNLLQNQPQCSQMQLETIPTFQPNQPQVSLQENLIAKSNPLNMEHQLIKSKLQNQISPLATSFSLQNLWHYDNGDNISGLSVPQSSSAMQCFSSSKFNSIFNNLLGNQNLSHNEGIPNFNLTSLLSSTTSSSPLNSSSSTTFFNGTTEDERDTYGSNILMYNISNGLNDSGLL